MPVINFIIITRNSKLKWILLGFQLNTHILEVIVMRYADQQCAIDFDAFVSCVIRLELLFSESIKAQSKIWIMSSKFLLYI